MSRFRAGGYDWLVRLDVGTIRRIRSRLAIDLFELLDQDRLSELGTDLATLADVVWICIEESAEWRGVAYGAFIEAIEGDALEAMGGAFGDAVLSFLPEPEPRDARKPAPAKDDDRDSMELMICKLASLIPIDPGPYTMRDLVAMVKTASTDRWNHTASTNHLMACIHRNPKTPPPHFSKFHPFEAPSKKRPGGITGSELQELAVAFKEHHTITLPPGEWLPGM